MKKLKATRCSELTKKYHKLSKDAQIKTKYTTEATKGVEPLVQIQENHIILRPLIWKKGESYSSESELSSRSIAKQVMNIGTNSK